MTSGTRPTVRRMCSICSGVSSRLPCSGVAPRPYDTMSNKGSPSRTLKTRFDMPGTPARLVYLQQGLGVAPQRLAYFEHRAELVTHRGRQPAALVPGFGDLIDVPADRRELADAALERQQFLLRQGGELAQVRTEQHGCVGRG